jgi:actin-related protein
MIQPVLAL